MHDRLMSIGFVVCLMAFSSHQKPAWAAASSGLTLRDAAAAPGCASYYDNTLKQIVYTTVEIDPAYGGGPGAWQRFLNKNLRIPNEVIDNEIQGSIITNALISQEGKLLDIRIDRKKDTSEYTALDKEFIRMVKQVPRWEPGYCQGKPVTCKTRSISLVCLKLETEQ